MKSKWRDVAKQIIAGVIKKVGLGDKKALRKALIDAYPFGERVNHPYKIWLDEIKMQTGKIKKNRLVNKRQLDILSNPGIK